MLDTLHTYYRAMARIQGSLHNTYRCVKPLQLPNYGISCSQVQGNHHYMHAV